MSILNPPSDDQLLLTTSRLLLEPIVEDHTQELWELFKDPELHRFVPFEPQSIDKQRERCARWAKRISPSGDEIWLNWAGRDKASRTVIAHLQAGVRSDGIASIGYLVGRRFQGQSYAREALETIFRFLREVMAVKEIKAWSDTRNETSHALARRLGMKQVELIKDADFFKGASSDEYVFSLKFGA